MKTYKDLIAEISQPPEGAKAHASYSDLRPRGTGYLYHVHHDGSITGSGNYRHNKKFANTDKAEEYLKKQGFTKSW
jgi:hypothetical protein